MKFTQIWTQSNYKFRLCLLKPNIYVITDHDFEHTKTVTNNIEEVLEHIFSGLLFEGIDRYKFFQYVENEGLYKLSFNLLKASIYTNGSVHQWPYSAANIKWEFITKDLKVFEILYAQK